MKQFTLPASPKTVHWGYFSKKVAPALTLRSGDRAGRQQLAVVTETETAAADAHGASVPAFEMIDAAEQRALAGAAGPEQRDDLADAHR